MIDEQLASGVLYPLSGFKNNRKDGSGDRFNFIFSNGEQTQNSDRECPTNFTHMMPVGVTVKSVEIQCLASQIISFHFFDQDHTQIFKIGKLGYKGYTVSTVVLESDEVIIGVVAQFYPRYSIVSSDFQFMIAKQ